MRVRVRLHLEVRQLGDAGPELLGRRLQDTEYPEQLVDLRVPLVVGVEEVVEVVVVAEVVEEVAVAPTWKSGRRLTISAKMVPMDQTSIGQEYLGEPSRTSGALVAGVTLTLTPDPHPSTSPLS